MKSFHRTVAVLALGLVGLPNAVQACGTPPPPADPLCIGFIGNSVIIQLGTIFQTSTNSSCAACIGLVGPPPGLNFLVAQLGVVNTSTNAFTTVFSLDRNPAADSAWSSGVDKNGTTPVPGATWFGFSNLAVPPVTPPTPGVNEIFAIRFVMSTPVPPGLGGLVVQYGSGAGTASGLPDFTHPADPNHAAQYSGLANVPAPGTNNWSPEPSSAVHAVTVLLALAGGYGLKRRRSSSR